jgi:hypothetical protein
MKKFSPEEDKLLLKYKEAGKTWSDIEREFSAKTGFHRSPDSLRMRYYRLTNTVDFASPPPDTASILKKRPTGVQLSELAKLRGITEREALAEVHNVMVEGADIAINRGLVFMYKHSSPLEFNIQTEDPEHILFGVTSDKHLGSRYQQITALNRFYDECYRRGVKHVLDCGDMLDGIGVYPGQLNEIWLTTPDEQEDYAVEHHPRRDGITTYGIMGNHPEAYIRYNAGNVLHRVMARRDDMVYIGRHIGKVNISGVEICLHHPTGGRAYAKSYKLQKFIDNMNPEKLPDFVFQGHYHDAGWFPDRRVHAYSAGAFQGQTPYGEAKGFPDPIIGGYIIEVVKTKRIERIIMEFIPYEEIYNDYPPRF